MNPAKTPNYSRNRSTIRQITTLPRLPERPPEAHKGTFGRVCVIGGSRDLIGAPGLAANSALRSGAGLVTVACPMSIQRFVAGICPCATTTPLFENVSGLINPQKVIKGFNDAGLLSKRNAPRAIAIGPGVGRGPAGFDRGWVKLIEDFGQEFGIPVVLDADGLNALAGVMDKHPSRSDPMPFHHLVMTPHPGEMARLCGISTNDVQHHRRDHAIELARRLSVEDADAEDPGRTVVVLKGANTIVTDGLRLFINETGNPGMATGGSGDVLTGIIAALIGQGLTRFDAAVLGAHVHGLAGDLAAAELGQTSLIATDLIDFLPHAFKNCTSPHTQML